MDARAAVSKYMRKLPLPVTHLHLGLLYSELVQLVMRDESGAGV